MQRSLHSLGGGKKKPGHSVCVSSVVVTAGMESGLMGRVGVHRPPGTVGVAMPVSSGHDALRRGSSQRPCERATHRGGHTVLSKQSQVLCSWSFCLRPGWGGGILPYVAFVTGFFFSHGRMFQGGFQSILYLVLDYSIT